MSACPKSAWPGVKAMLHSVYDQPDTEAVHAQFDKLLDTLATTLPAVAEHLDGARADILAFTSFPKEIWRQIWSNNPIVIWSHGDAQRLDLGVCVVDGVVDVIAAGAGTGLEFVELGVSRRGGLAVMRRLSPRASARAWRSCLLSASSSRMRAVANSRRWWSEASEQCCRRGKAGPVREGVVVRRRSISARRSGWV
jgi:hypothetical protein